MSGRIVLGVANPALDANGNVDATATLTFYQNLTTTPQTVYAEAALTTPLANPLSCDAAGRFPAIWAPSTSIYSIKWTPTGATPITYNDIVTIGTTTAFVCNTIAELKAIDTTGLVSGAVAFVAGHLAAGDGASRTMQWKSGATTTDDGGWVIQPNGGVTGRWLYSGPRDVLPIDHFGATAASVDNAAAVKVAILAAKNQGVAVLGIPFMTQCASGITQNISGVSGEDYGLPDGMQFVGLTRKAENAAVSVGGSEPGLWYSGAGTFIDIRNGLGTSIVGGWGFKNLKLKTSVAAAHFMRINWLTIAGATYTPTNDATTPKYVQHVRIENCYCLGSHGPGDFIQACKVFDLFVDEQTWVREWRRGFNLNGCDRPVIRCNVDLNGRHVHIDSVNTFGNAADINFRQMGNTDSGSTSENRYCMWDQGRGTRITCGLIEDSQARATIYINGSYCNYNDVYFGSTTPAFELGSAALRCRIINPHAPVGGFVLPLINSAGTNNFGSANGDFRLTIIDADRNLIEHIGANPRIRYVHPSNSAYSWDQATTPVLFPGGGRASHMFMDAANFAGILDTADAGVSYLGVSGTGAYAGTITGYGFEFDAPVATVPYGTMVRLVCGDHFKPSDWLRLGVRGLKTTAGSAGTVDVQIRKNGVIVGVAFPLTITTSFGNTWIEKQLTTFVVGDVLQILLLNNRDVRFVLDCFDMTFTETQIADLASPVFVDAATTHALVLTMITDRNAFLGATRSRA